eukprot:m.142654 g.142654  ORF g.142654 m.142654 type:complete len:248 (-) comp14884_c0_seq5:192-935(-)
MSGPDKDEHPPAAKIDTVIIPISYNRNDGERAKVLDAAKVAKVALAEAKVNVWTDMRKSYSPSQKFQYWESLDLLIRIEIGPKDVDAGEFIIADLANKIKHPNGRMIAKRTRVKIDSLVEETKIALSNAKLKGGNKKRKFDETPEVKGDPEQALLGLLDSFIAKPSSGKAASGDDTETTENPKKKKKKTSKKKTKESSEDTEVDGKEIVSSESNKVDNGEDDDSLKKKRKKDKKTLKQKKSKKKDKK